MKKKNVISSVVLSLCLAMGLSMGASADSRKVVTLGADLTDQQKQIVMNYFGVSSSEVDILTITNQDEREHLGAYVPIEQIGTHTYSCALVCPTTSGGIQVKTANMDWVTCNMIATTLSTSGVVNCDVIAASPIKVSGTGALTGIIMAYERASGEELDPTKKDLATQELVITGQLADNVGQKEATAIVNEAKTEIISQNITDITIIQNVINEAATNNDALLTQEDLDVLTDLLDKISQEDYDYDEMKDTLDRVEDNVGIVDVDELGSSDDAEAAAAAAAEEAENQVDTEEPSILDLTNDDAFGEEVISGSTQEPETDLVETEPQDWDDGTLTLETEMPVEVQGGTDEPVEDEIPVDESAETEWIPVEETEPEYTEDDLSEEDKMTYKQINWYLAKVLGADQEPSDSEEYAEINAMEVTTLDLSLDKADYLMDQFDTALLELLVKGTEEIEMSDEDDLEYELPEVKVLTETLEKLLVDDEEQILTDVDPVIRELVVDEAEVFFKKVYGIETDEEYYEEEEDLEGDGEEFSEEEEYYEDDLLSEDDYLEEGEIPEALEDGTYEG